MTPIGTTDMTAAQLTQYSDEWRTFFFDLMFDGGYDVNYRRGVLLIEGHGVEMTVHVKKGCWEMQLFIWNAEPITRRSRYDDKIRELILYWLNKARQNPLYQKHPFGGASA